MKIIKCLPAFLLFCIGSVVFSQELTCYVSVNSSQVQGTNTDIFKTLEETMTDFMNNTVWTNNVFEINERIECNLTLNVKKEVSSGKYEATLAIQSRRPVYGTSYNSVMLNYVDDYTNFTYNEFDPLEFSEASHLNNLSSVLAFYAYIIIGMDYDSYSLNGGDPFYQIAEKIVNNAQSSADVGWNPADARGRDNRYWLVNNLRDDGYKPLREFNYNYHRQGLDMLESSLDRGRLMIKEQIINLEKFNKNKPDPFIHLFNVILQAKAEEIVNIFSEATPEDKAKVYTIMTSIDPAGSSKYAPLQGQ
jgi:hypothetical protein